MILGPLKANSDGPTLCNCANGGIVITKGSLFLGVFKAQKGWPLLALDCL